MANITIQTAPLKVFSRMGLSFGTHILLCVNTRTLFDRNVLQNVYIEMAKICVSVSISNSSVFHQLLYHSKPSNSNGLSQ